ncbi:hypothetical protein BGX28_005879 [Mortierella sp. GBA30]|nr:hypothetical protein BGX28_005879 [Mortierella sp. GBA30]
MRLLSQAHSVDYESTVLPCGGINNVGPNWSARFCDGEADIAVHNASKENVESVVVTGYSDLLMNAPVRTVYRPHYQKHFLRYDTEECAKKLEVSRNKLVALGIPQAPDVIQAGMPTPKRALSAEPPDLLKPRFSYSVRHAGGSNNSAASSIKKNSFKGVKAKTDGEKGQPTANKTVKKPKVKK